MNAIQELRKILDTRMHGDPDKYYEVTLWEDMVTLICSHMQETMVFIRESCTDEELYWLGEIYDDIMEQSRSVGFLKCLRERAEHVENPEWKKEILIDIQDAAQYVE